MSRTVYIVAAEYSAPPGASRVESAFDRTRGAEPPALLPLMQNAARRALDAVPAAARRRLRIDHFLLTTMPICGGLGSDLRLPDDAMNLPGLLQRSLELPDHCVTRFEMGSSDGGAALFASGVRLLQGVGAPTTALMVAGQVMPRGAAAIETVGQVIEVSERETGLRMIPVGDLLLDAFWARLQARCRAGDPGAPADPTALAGLLAASKLRLAAEYAAAMRRDADIELVEGQPLARWLHDAHVAQACNGACAVVLTTDEAVVEALIAAGHRRLVRVLGVGEGNDDPVLGRRTEPLMLFKAMRQSLVFLRRAVGAHVDFLRGSAFAILHDAFPSIELGFLSALGFDAPDAVERAASYWSNPYGGLTAFGHAMAASGMVQIAKAFHVLTRPPAYLPSRVDAPSRHPDHTRSDIPIHCLTTSVGGPMTHVVASLLQSVPVEDGVVPQPFALERAESLPDDARRPPADQTRAVWAFEGKVEWVAERCAAFRLRCAAAAAEEGAAGLGIVVGRTRLDLRSMALPLPDGFLDAWDIPPFVGADGVEKVLPRSTRALLAGALATSRQAVTTAVDAVVSVLLDAGADARERRVVRRQVYATLRPPVALVDGGGPGLSTPHAVCLLPDEQVPVGALVEVLPGVAGGLPWIRRDLSASRPALIPPWYGAPGGEDTQPVLALTPAGRDRIANLIRTLRAGPVPGPTWVPVFELVGVILDAFERDERPATAALERLTHTVVYAPDPDRWTIAEAFETLCGVEAAPPPADELTAYVEFDLWRAGDRSAAELARLFDTVEEAISRARGWLGGSDLHLSRLGDTYAAIARRRPPPMSTRTGAELWPQVLHFARDVYDACLRRNVPLRVVVDVSTDGMPIIRGSAWLGVAGAGPIEAHLVMMNAMHFHRRGASAEVGVGHGIALVRSGPALVREDAALVGWARSRWAEVGGLDGYASDHARLDDRAFYHVSWREVGPAPLPRLRSARPFDARDDVVGVLCFSERDRASAEALSEALAGAGLPFWSDEPIEAGDFWHRQVAARAASSEVVLVLAGPDVTGWADSRVQARLQHLSTRGARLIRVILPGGKGNDDPGETVIIDDPDHADALLHALGATCA